MLDTLPYVLGGLDDIFVFVAQVVNELTNQFAFRLLRHLFFDEVNIILEMFCSSQRQSIAPRQ